MCLYLVQLKLIVHSHHIDTRLSGMNDATHWFASIREDYALRIHVERANQIDFTLE